MGNGAPTPPTLNGSGGAAARGAPASGGPGGGPIGSGGAIGSGGGGAPNIGIGGTPPSIGGGAPTGRGGGAPNGIGGAPGGAPGGGANVPSGGAQCGGSGGAPGSCCTPAGAPPSASKRWSGDANVYWPTPTGVPGPTAHAAPIPCITGWPGAPAGCAAGRVPFAPTPPKPPKAGGWGIDGWT